MSEFRFGKYIDFTGETTLPHSWGEFTPYQREQEIMNTVLTGMNSNHLEQYAGIGLIPSVMITGVPGSPKLDFVLAFCQHHELPLYLVECNILLRGGLPQFIESLSDLFTVLREVLTEQLGVVVFNSIDLISRSRADATESGDLKRSAGVFYSELSDFLREQYMAMVVGITSFPELIDDEVMSLFPLSISFDVLNRLGALNHWRVLESKVKIVNPKTVWDIDKLAETSVGLTHRQLEQVLALSILEMGKTGKNSIETSLLLQQLQLMKRSSEGFSLKDSDIDLRELGALLEPYFRQKR